MATFFENLWTSIFTPGPTPTLLVATNVTFGALQFVLALLLASTKSIHFVVLSALCAGLWWSINWFAAELAQAEQAEKEAGRLRRRRTGNMDEKRERDRDAAGYAAEDSTETETEVEGKTVGGVRIRGGPGKAQAVMDSANSETDDSFAGSGRVEIRGGPGKAQAVMESAGITQDDEAQETGPVRVRGGVSKIAGVMRSAEDAQAARESAAASASGFQAPQTRGGPGKASAVLASSQGAPDDSNLLGSGDRNAAKRQSQSGSVSTDSEWEKVSDR